MKRLNHASILLVACVLSISLAACGGADAEPTPTAAPTTAAVASPTPVVAPSVEVPNIAAVLSNRNVFATGEVAAAQDADLVFRVNGTVGRVLTEEGQDVRAGQLLAVLDTRSFDQNVRNAEASLVSAQADRLALTEDPTNEQVRAAQAAVNQSVSRLTEVQGSVTEADLIAARASVDEARAALADLQAGADNLEIEAVQIDLNNAQVNLQQTRDRLSQAKSQAEISLEQAAERVRVAQVDYSAAYWDWRYVQDYNRAPPVTENDRQPELSDHSEQSYRDALTQSEIALEQAEDSLASAEQSLEEARLAEITGVQTAEQQIESVQNRLEQVLEPAEADLIAAAQARVANAEANLARLQGAQRAGQIGAAQASIESAQANLDQLYSDPTESQLIRAEANIARAEASLEQAKLNREYAEIRAPFAGEVAVVNVDPGDPGTTAGAGSNPAIRLVDLSDVNVEVEVSDADIARVEEGQMARVVPDALIEEVFTGEVVFISPTADTSGSVTTYLVRIRLDDPADTPLRVGMSVSVTIETEDTDG